MAAYISRRLSVTDKNKNKVEYSDTEFFAINAPLIVLGEPGAGKSKLVKQFAKASASKVINASTVESLSVIEMKVHPSKIIIDGIDEITAYNKGTPINQILAKIPQDRPPNFVLTCRAIDWQDTVNSLIIHQKWNKKPIIGRLLPLNSQEIVEFVNVNGQGLKGEAFIKEATQHDVIDLLKNPQYLEMLLNTVQKNGWPATRSELFKNASLALIQEANETHSSINRTHLDPQKSMKAAGFIFAQLLFSGKSSICIEGNRSPELPKVTDLAGGDSDEEIIRQALSTKVFRVSGENMLEPCHRTIVEFLAANWIANSLNNQLSLRRLESLLYGNRHIVPTALRGLYAWIASLYPARTKEFIGRDPYGFLRYGDPSKLTIQQSRYLLKCLENMAQVDPYFRSEDWHSTFGKGLAKPELRDDFVRIISNLSSPYQLTQILVESIRGDHFTNLISDELKALILDSSIAYSVRRAAIYALNDCEKQPNWLQMVDILKNTADKYSIRAALDIIKEKTNIFSGNTIANVLIVADESKESRRHMGLDFGVESKMSSRQLEDCLHALSQYQSIHNGIPRKGYRNPTDRIFIFLRELLGRGAPPNTSTILNWLQSTNRHSYRKSNWDEFAKGYFSEHIELRQAMQSEVLKNARDEKEYRQQLLFNLKANHPALQLQEDDIILLLDSVMASKHQNSDWFIRWRHLVDFIKNYIGFTGSAFKHAKQQAEQQPELMKQLIELEQVPKHDFEEEKNARTQKRMENMRRETQEIHKSYEQIQNELITGQNLMALEEVANAYLGDHYYVPVDKTGIDGVAELVGDKALDAALEGLKTTIRRDDVPSARQLIEIHATNRRPSHFEPILLAYCAHISLSGQSLTDIPLGIQRSALAACRWGIKPFNELMSDVQRQLEEIVFAIKDSKACFVRDTIEPYLDHGEKIIPGLSRISEKQEFSDIAGELAIEWLKKYRRLSNSTLQELLTAAIFPTTGNELILLIREHMKNKQWESEEQRGNWMEMAFLMDYEHHRDQLDSYASEGSDRLWSFMTKVTPVADKSTYWPKLNAEQNYFLIAKFALFWPIVDNPRSGLVGERDPWDANQFIYKRIDALAACQSDQAEKLLKGLTELEGLHEGYLSGIKHAYAQNIRKRAEESKEVLPLDQIQNILLQGEPADHDDLQALLIDELEALQDRIRNSATNEILPYWDGDTPHNENYCRDRIAAGLNPYLERKNVRTDPEGAMPDNKRCDLLCTHDFKDVTIEIKGQWHPDIWDAASEQLENYTKEYQAKGRGIYLVLWFGYLEPNHGKNPRGWENQSLPKTIDEMRNLLSKRYKGISEKTKIFVLDASKPRRN